MTRYGSLSQEDFLQQVSDPHVLLVERKSVRDSDSGFLTVKFTKEILAESGERKTFVLPVKKREGSNAFAMMITVGRAANNDMVVEHQKISKFHAYFRNSGAAWSICDADSRNGTIVDGVQVPTGQQGLAIQTGSRIKLAKVIDLEFFEPSALFDRLQADPSR
jgi:pSer/pThr/pTyr-binding forkhead associated (FHA) protein